MLSNHILQDEVDGGDGGAGGGGGAASAPFIDSVPEALRESVTKAGIDSLEKLTQNWSDAQRAMGSMIRIPGKDAGAEDIQRFDARLTEAVPGLMRIPGDDDVEGWKALHNRLGVPEVATGYKFNPVDGLPEPTVQKLDEWIAGLAHKANVPAKAAAVMREGWIESLKVAGERERAAQAAAVDELRTEWGSGFDHRIQMGRQLLINAGGDDGRVLAEEHLTAENLAANPLLAKVLATLAAKVGEDTVIKGDGGNSGTLSRAEIDAKINEIRGNKDHAFHNARDPSHKDAVARMNSLYELKASLTSSAA